MNVVSSSEEVLFDYLINKTLHTEIDPRNKGMALPNTLV
jgi:hypothetical protein